MKGMLFSTIALGIASTINSVNIYADDQPQFKTFKFNNAEFKVYGIVDIYAGKIETQLPGVKETRLDPSGLSPSYFGISGKYTISDNLNLVGSLESYFRPDEGEIGRFDGDKTFAKQSFIGLQGKYGQLSVGRTITPYFMSTVITDPFEGAVSISPVFMQTYNGGTLGVIAGDGSWDNSVSYEMPNYKGLTSTITYAKGEKEESGSNKISANIMYFTEPLILTVSGYSVKAINNPLESGSLAMGTFQQQDAVMAGAMYRWGSLKLNAEMHKLKTDVVYGEIDTSIYTAGFSIPVEKNGKIMFGYSYSDVTGVMAYERENVSLVYDHNFTKDLDVYGSVGYEDLSTMSSGSTVLLGIRYKFNTMY